MTQSDEFMEEEEGSFFAMIPTELLLSKDITSFQKVLYADIQALVYQEGYCSKSNAFLAKRHGKSAGYISKQISMLADCNHLFLVHDDGSDKRKIFTESTYIEYLEYMQTL